jgi:oligopeptide transport system substrate-binding protein
MICFTAIISSLRQTHAARRRTETGAQRRRISQLCLLALMVLALVACQKATNSPLVVTRVVMVGGQEVVVTRVVLQTVQAPAVATAALAESVRPVELDLSFRGALPNLDPHRPVDRNGMTLIENLFVGLTSYNHQTNQVESALAHEWEVSDNGRVWTFYLRDDFFWVRPLPPPRFNANAPLEVRAVRQVTAADMVYTIQRVCQPETGTPDVFLLFVIEGCEALNLGSAPAAEESASVGARALDDFTLQITLVRPAAHFLTLTSMWLLRPLPAESIAEYKDRWTDPENLMTNGPFVMSPQSLGGTRTILQHNPFWPIAFAGNIDIVNIVYLQDDEDAFRLWESRNLDLSPLPAAERARILRNSPTKAELIIVPELFYIAYNFNSPVFRHPEVRRAFGAAINRDRLIREVYGGRGFPMRHFTPPGAVGAIAIDEVGTGYSPDEARRQMASSRLVDCRFMPSITYLVSSSDLALQQAELLREMWAAELGCRAESIVLEQVQFGALLANTRRDAGALRPDMWELAWAPYYPDAHNWLTAVLHCVESENRQNRPCSEVDELMQQATLTIDQAERQQLYRQAERLFFGPDGIEPISPLYVRGRYMLRHSWLTYTPALFGGEQFHTYSIDPIVKELERLR